MESSPLPSGQLKEHTEALLPMAGTSHFQVHPEMLQRPVPSGSSPHPAQAPGEGRGQPRLTALWVLLSLKSSLVPTQMPCLPRRPGSQASPLPRLEWGSSDAQKELGAGPTVLLS